MDNIIDLYSYSLKDIKPGRAVGNSTRQINNAIELLFEGYEVKVTDHSGNERYYKELLARVILRLETEFPNQKFYINPHRNTIKLKD